MLQMVGIFKLIVFRIDLKNIEMTRSTEPELLRQLVGLTIGASMAASRFLMDMRRYVFFAPFAIKHTVSKEALATINYLQQQRLPATAAIPTAKRLEWAPVMSNDLGLIQPGFQMSVASAGVWCYTQRNRFMLCQ